MRVENLHDSIKVIQTSSCPSRADTIALLGHEDEIVCVLYGEKEKKVCVVNDTAGSRYSVFPISE